MQNPLTIEEIRSIAFEYGGTPYKVAKELHMFSDFQYQKKDFEIYEYVRRACHAEKLIRERYDMNFSLERIDYEDDRVMSNIAGLVSSSLPKSWFQKFMGGEMPGGQAVLTYQICFLRTYYEKELLEVSKEEYQPEHSRTNCGRVLSNDGILGISVCRNEFYAACKTENGILRRVPCRFDDVAPNGTAFVFYGYRDILNAGVAYSEAGLAFLDILTKAERNLNTKISYVNIVTLERFPSASKIEDAMFDRDIHYGDGTYPNEDFELTAYEEIRDTFITGKEIIGNAAQAAKLPDVNFVNLAKCVTAFYENEREENLLPVGDNALVLCLDDYYMYIAVVTKNENQRIVELESVGKEVPVDEWVFEDVNNFLREKGYNDSREENNTVGNVKRQFQRNEKAELHFEHNGGYEDRRYPIERFERVVRRALDIMQKEIEKYMYRLGMKSERNIKVYLSGSYFAYPFVQEWIKEVVQGKFVLSYDPECVAAKGAALIQR